MAWHPSGRANARTAPSSSGCFIATTASSRACRSIASGAGNEQAIALAKEESLGLGLFIRSLVGLDQQAALEAFADYLDGGRFTANQLHFINLIVGELTSNGVMEPARLYESPFTDLAATGPELMFTESEVDNIVDILNTVRANASPIEGVA